LTLTGTRRASVAVAFDHSAQAARLAQRRATIKTGKKLNQRSLIAVGFVILATSLPTRGYTAKAILPVYRLR